jgi:hypothetical protein
MVANKGRNHPLPSEAGDFSLHGLSQYLFRPGTVFKLIFVTGITERFVPGQTTSAEGELLFGFKAVSLRICQLYIAAYNQGTFIPDLNLDIRHEITPYL